MNLSKRLVVALLATGTFVTANAQIQFGVKAGPSFTSFTGSDAGGAKLLVGFHGGAFVKIPIINDQFSLQPEVQYSGQGAKGTDETSGVSFTNRNNYVNVPVMFTFTHSSGLILQTGPQVGFLISSKVTAQGVSADTKDVYKSTDIGWGTGLGYISTANIGFIARYSIGWLNAENTNNQNNTGGGSIRNIGFQLSVFYLFGSNDR
jgi:hypothetical protein